MTDAPVVYLIDGDPFSDPPRARSCRRCGALVAREFEEKHTEWHGILDPFGCTEGKDHKWEFQGSRGWCRRCQATTNGKEVNRD